MSSINIQAISIPETAIILTSVAIFLARKQRKIILLILILMSVSIVSVLVKNLNQTPRNTYIWVQIAFTLILVYASIYALFRNRVNEICAGLIYGGSAIYLLKTNNLLVFFCLIEIMLVAGSYIIFGASTKSSRASGLRYLKMHILAGTFILLGIIDHYETFYTFNFVKNNFYKIRLDDYSTYKHIFLAVGLLINSAIFPFSAWLPDSYPKATNSGSLFLSIFTTKISLFFLSKIYWGEHSLIYFGIVTTCYASLYFILENNLKRMSAYYMLIQNGLILCVIGLGGDKVELNFQYILSCSAIYSFYMMYITSYVSEMHKINYFVDLKFEDKKQKVFLLILLGFMLVIGLPYTISFVSKYLMLESRNYWLIYNLIYYSSIAICIGSFGKILSSISIGKDLKLKSFFDKRDFSYFLTLIILILGGSFFYSLLDIKISSNILISKFVDLVVAILTTKIFYKLIENRKYNLLLDVDWFYRGLLMTVYKILLLGFIKLKNAAISKKQTYKEAIGKLLVIINGIETLGLNFVIIFSLTLLLVVFFFKI